MLIKKETKNVKKSLCDKKKDEQKVKKKDVGQKKREQKEADQERQNVAL